MPEATAADAMATVFPRISRYEKVRQAVAQLVEAGWASGLILSDEDVPIGTFGRREMLRTLSERTGGFFSEEELGFAYLQGEVFRSEAVRDVWRACWDSTVETVMRREVPMVTEDTSLAAVADRIVRSGCDAAAVVRDGRIVGAIRSQDIVSWIAAHPESFRGARGPRAGPS